MKNNGGNEKQCFITFSEQHILQNIDKNIEKKKKIIFRTVLLFPLHVFKRANNGTSKRACLDVPYLNVHKWGLRAIDEGKFFLQKTLKIWHLWSQKVIAWLASRKEWTMNYFMTIMRMTAIPRSLVWKTRTPNAE